MSGYQVLDKSGKVIYSSGRGSVCDESCRNCIFHATVTGGMIVCDYLLVMGHRRGCEAGKNCRQRINGKKAPSLDSRLYRLPPNPERETGVPAAALRAIASGDGMAAAAGDPSSAPSGHLPQGEGKTMEPSPSGKEEKAAERKRRKAEYQKRWAAKNRERLLEYQRQYRARKRGEQS